MFMCCANQQADTESVVVPVSQNGNEKFIVNDIEEKAQAAPAPKIEEPPPAPTPEPVPVAIAPEPAKASASSPEFTVKLSKGGQVLGLDLVLNEEKSSLLVESIKADSITSTYNNGCTPDQKICIGDYIIDVNRTTGPDMIERLKSDSELELKVIKSQEITLTIPRNGGKLGMNLVYQDQKDYIIVKGILDGAVKDYNASAPVNKQVKVPSRILAVNGTVGSGKELFAKLSTAEASVDLKFSQAIG